MESKTRETRDQTRQKRDRLKKKLLQNERKKIVAKLEAIDRTIAALNGPPDIREEDVTLLMHGNHFVRLLLSEDEGDASEEDHRYSGRNSRQADDVHTAETSTKEQSAQFREAKQRRRANYRKDNFLAVKALPHGKLGVIAQPVRHFPFYIDSKGRSRHCKAVKVDLSKDAFEIKHDEETMSDEESPQTLKLHLE